MKKFIIELAVGFCASLEVEAKNQFEAIQKAKELVIMNPMDYCEDVEIEDVNFIKEKE